MLNRKVQLVFISQMAFQNAFAETIFKAKLLESSRELLVIVTSPKLGKNTKSYGGFVWAPLKATVYAWAHTCAHEDTCLCIWMCVYMHMSLHVHTYGYSCQCVHVCICPSVLVHFHGCSLWKGGSMCFIWYHYSPEMCAFDPKFLLKIAFKNLLCFATHPSSTSGVCFLQAVGTGWKRRKRRKEIEVSLDVNNGY